MIAYGTKHDIGDYGDADLDRDGQRMSDPHSEMLLLRQEPSNRSAATTKGDAIMTPIGIPEDWDDDNLILFEEFCELIRTPQRTVRDWRQRGVGPRWTRFQGIGRLYITVAEARRFLASATVKREEVRSDG